MVFLLEIGSLDWRTPLESSIARYMIISILFCRIKSDAAWHLSVLIPAAARKFKCRDGYGFIRCLFLGMIVTESTNGARLNISRHSTSSSSLPGIVRYYYGAGAVVHLHTFTGWDWSHCMMELSTNRKC